MLPAIQGNGSEQRKCYRLLTNGLTNFLKLLADNLMIVMVTIMAMETMMMMVVAMMHYQRGGATLPGGDVYLCLGLKRIWKV